MYNQNHYLYLFNSSGQSGSNIPIIDKELADKNAIHLIKSTSLFNKNCFIDDFPPYKKILSLNSFNSNLIGFFDRNMTF